MPPAATIHAFPVDLLFCSDLTRASPGNMYGFLHCALAEMITKVHGEDTWKNIMRMAGIELGGGSFLIHKHYSDSVTNRLLHAATNILNTTKDELLEEFGQHFLQYCIDCGYDRLLRVLGGNLHDFLCNLDALHDHLSSIYPGLRAPSFRCSHGDDGTITLHYHSDRSGFEGLVIGIIRAVAKEFFDSKVKITIVNKQGKHNGHTVFSIKEDAFQSLLIRKRSSSLVSHLHKAKASSNPKDLPLSVSNFCKAFPFHIIIDRHMEIVQAGVSLLRVVRPKRTPRNTLPFTEVFDIVRPVINVTFDSILDHINTVFIVVTRLGVLVTSQCDGMHVQEQTMRLKGQMVFVPETDSILFLCSPRVCDIDDLRLRGLYLSDIPIHDSTRDLILIAQARRAEHELVEKLEETSNNLKKLQNRLQEDSKRTDELLYSILPYSVAEKLRLNQTVEAEKYDLVTIMFSDIVGFTAMCSYAKVVPMDVVRLLNKLYTQFDVLSGVHEVYKVETIGDAYMVVGGVPDFYEGHCDQATAMAFDMMHVAHAVLSPVDQLPIKIRIGIHSGPCVAGVVGQKMPRYCLFGQTVTVASLMENSSLPGKINISQGARKYLTSPQDFNYEENTTRADLPVTCYFIKRKQEIIRPISVDLGLPEPRGMFRTPNPSPLPSPVSSNCQSPCDHLTPSTSPPKLNSPENMLPKFKMPAIHICDADEDAKFRATLKLKMAQMSSSINGSPDVSRSFPSSPSRSLANSFQTDDRLNYDASYPYSQGSMTSHNAFCIPDDLTVSGQPTPIISISRSSSDREGEHITSLSRSAESTFSQVFPDGANDNERRANGDSRTIADHEANFFRPTVSEGIHRWPQRENTPGGCDSDKGGRLELSICQDSPTSADHCDNEQDYLDANRGRSRLCKTPSGNENRPQHEGNERERRGRARSCIGVPIDHYEQEGYSPDHPHSNSWDPNPFNFDINKIKENGRLVIYFKNTRQRSLSPRHRIRPVTGSEGSFTSTRRASSFDPWTRRGRGINKFPDFSWDKDSNYDS